ncbi:MAG: hypothetical protein AAFX00_12675 [Pseudomonadota bacterium]
MIEDRRHGRTELRSWGSLFLAVGLGPVLACLLTALGWGVLAYPQLVQALEFNARGMVAEAEVVRKSEKDGLWVAFRFEADGAVVAAWRRVDKDLFAWAEIGNRQDIRYLPDAPEDFETYPGESSQGLWFLIAILLFLPALAIFLAVFAAWNAARAIEARDNGKPLIMLVRGVRKERYLWVFRRSWVVFDLPVAGKAHDYNMSKIGNLGDESISLMRGLPYGAWKDYAKLYKSGDETVVYAKHHGNLVLYWWVGDVGPRR